MRRDAYTLIEMLVVVMILAAVIGAVVSVLAAGVSAWESTVHFESGLMDSVLVVEELERDIRNAVDYPGVDFLLDRSRMSFATVVPSDDCSGTRVVRVDYAFDGAEQRIIRTARDLPEGTGNARAAEVIAERIKGIRFDALQLPGDSPGEMPLRVIVKIDLDESDDGRSLTRTVNLPLRRKDEGL